MPVAGNATLTVFGTASTQSLGFHYYQAVEYGGINGGTDTWYGLSTTFAQNDLTYLGRF